MHTFDIIVSNISHCVLFTLHGQKKKVLLSNTPYGVNINKLKVPFKVKGYIFQRFNGVFMYKE